MPDLDVAFKLFLGKDGFIIYPTAMSMCVSCWQGIDSSANRVPLGTTKSNASSWCCPILWRFAISITVFIGSTSNFRLNCKYIVGTSTPLLVIFHYTPKKNLLKSSFFCWSNQSSAILHDDTNKTTKHLGLKAESAMLREGLFLSVSRGKSPE